MDNRNNQKKNAGLYVILLLFLIYVGWAVGRVDFQQVTIENFEETIILALTDPWSAPLITKNSVLLTVFLSFLWGLLLSVQNGQIPGSSCRARVWHQQAADGKGTEPLYL